MKNKEFLTSREISTYLDIPLRTIQKLTQYGKIKGIKVGKQWRYRKSDIENYFAFGTDFSKEPAGTYNNYIEKRAYPRINSNFQCQYLIDLIPFKEINASGIIKDIGAAGIFLFNREVNQIDVNDPIELNFIMASDDNQKIDIKTRGRIVRKNETGLGIRFKNLDKRLQDIIKEYVG